MDLEPVERYRPLVDDWDAFVEAARRPLPTTVWTNHLRTTPSELEEWFCRAETEFDAVEWYDGAYRLPDVASPGNRVEYMAGLYHVQEEASLIPPVLLAAQPDERVLDLCAAPGNKTAQLAVDMRNRGTVVANDRDTNRLRAVRRVLDRLGLLNVSVINHDGTNLPSEIGRFDAVLVDVPCSCEGNTRKSPNALSTPAEEFAPKVAGTQEALLRRGLQLCRPGGRVVYSTCTYAPEENERIVDRALEAVGSETDRIAPARIDGLHVSRGLLGWRGDEFREDMENAMRVWPHQNDTGGFFVAVIERGA